MGTDRIPPTGKLVRGPGGHYCCRQCGKEVEPPRRTFCSDACVEAWKQERDPNHQRKLVFERDRGRCSSCRLDTLALQHRLEGMVELLSENWARELGLRLVARNRYDLNHLKEAFFSRVSRFWSDKVNLAYVVEEEARHGRALFTPVELGPFLRLCRAAGLAKPYRGQHLWEMDHEKPVVEGGGGCGLDGLRTLCLPCHRRVTRELRARLSARRKAGS